MPAASLSSIRRALERGRIAPVYYVTGEEEILKDELVARILEAAVDPANRDFNLDVGSAGELDAERFHTIVETPPVLAERRVAVVRNIEQWRKNSKPWQILSRYVSDPASTTTLVLVAGAGHQTDTNLAAHALHVVVRAPEDEELRTWVTARAERVGLALAPDAADHLLVAVGRDLTQLAVEIEKLAAASDGDIVGVSAVEDLVGIRRGETIHDWVDAVLKRDIPRAVSLFEVVMSRAGVTGVKMLMALGTALVGVRLARTILDDGKGPRQAHQELLLLLRRVRPMGLGRYSEEVTRWIGGADRWTGDEIETALRGVFDTDRRLKSTQLSDTRGTMTTMLLGFASRLETG